MSRKLPKTVLVSILGLGLAISQLQAAISINVTAEKLKDPGGFDMAVTGLLVLVGSTTDANFSGPSSTEFAQDDDAVVAIWDIASDGGNTPGAFSGGTGSVSLGGEWDAGDPLAIYWFPSLTISDSAPGEGVPFGMFRVESGNPDGTDDWVTPADGTIGHNLKFVTTDATVLQPGGGSSDADDGLPSNIIGDAISAPTAVAAAADGPGKVAVTWTDNAGGTAGFRVERKTGSGAYEILGTVAAGATSYDDLTVGSQETYTYRVVAIEGAAWSAYAESAEVTSAGLTARFTNLSNRALVGTGDDILIGSLRLRGGPLRVYARVGGPVLANSGITNFLADPSLELIRLSDGTTVASNDNWKIASDGSDQTAEIQATFIPPANDAEPALVANLTEEGFYSVVVRGVGDTEGFANVEIYEYRDPSEPAPGKLTNLSNRALVGTGDDILIGSLRVRGDAPQRIYARVGGPVLASSGITNFLADPTIEIVRVSDGQVMASNDNWKVASDGSDQTAEIQATFIPPANDAEPAVVVTLDPENFYSVVVRGVNDTEGFANVEIYDYPE